jgi:hypothetical protein
MIRVGIIHYTASQRCTLPATIASLHAAGIGQVKVYADGGEFGPTRNLIRAMRDLAQGEGPELMVVVDDDLIFDQSFLLRITSPLRFYRSGYSLWTIEQNIPHDRREERGWLEVEPHYHLWGGSVIMPCWLAQAVAEVMQDVMEEAPETLARKPDSVLFEAMRRTGTRLFFHVPSLVDHIGTTESTIGNEHHDGQTAGYLFPRNA